MSNTFYTEHSQYQDSRRSHWNGVARDTSRSWGGYYRNRLIQVFRLHVPEASKVLEVGCARGDLLAALKPEQGIGVDISPEMVAAARNRHPTLSFIVSDAHQLDLGEHTFDFIILSDVINDMWDLQLVLQQLRRYCCPQTRIIFNFFSHLWQVPLALAQTLGVATPNLPQNWFTRHDVENLLELSGYEPLRSFEEVVAPLPFPVLSNFANRFFIQDCPLPLDGDGKLPGCTPGVGL